MLRLILVMLVIAILKTTGASGQGIDLERGDGTLPLRLRGDGTLPLKLSGQAVGGATQLETKITITRATSAALPASDAAALTCQMRGAEVSKHAARGTILVGLAQFTIKGICYDHGNREMEVVAQRRAGQDVETSFMAGPLAGAEPSTFAGRLVVTGETPPAGRYSFRTVTEVVTDPR